jgi:hypothetical protein
MKRLTFILLLACFAFNQPQKDLKKGTKDIIEETPMLKLFKSSGKLNHLYDVVVLHSSLVRNGNKLQVYFVNAFSCNNSNAGFGLAGDILFDKVQYTWANDSVLKFRLFNSKNNHSVSSTLTSYRNGNALLQTDLIDDIPVDLKR